MTLTIIIFNYNYLRFLDKLFDSLKSSFNHPEINIFFCDDGSCDGSYEFVSKYIRTNLINNLKIIKVSSSDIKRKNPSFGQIEGVKLVMSEHNDLVNDYVCLIDSDDWIADGSIAGILKEVKNTRLHLYLNDLRDTNSYGDLNVRKRILQRKIYSINTKIWPTIVPTSGIVISRNFLKDNFDKLTNLNDCFSDVWLDSRINILGMNYKSSVKYTDILIYRLIHGNNDSLNFNLKRTLKKQVQVSQYFNYAVSTNLKMNLRKRFLEFIHV
jgi:hypothetical protein